MSFFDDFMDEVLLREELRDDGWDWDDEPPLFRCGYRQPHCRHCREVIAFTLNANRKWQPADPITMQPHSCAARATDSDFPAI